MKNLSIEMFDKFKIGKPVHLKTIVGGRTFVQTGSNGGPGGTTRDFSGDNGGSDQCDVPDDANPS